MWSYRYKEEGHKRTEEKFYVGEEEIAIVEEYISTLVA